MRAFILLSLVMAALVVSGCASAPLPEKRALSNVESDDQDKDKILVSDEAFELINSKGEATAAFRGYSRDTDIICEHLYFQASHRKTTYCYTREERDKIRFNNEETWRRLLQPPPRVGN